MTELNKCRIEPNVYRIRNADGLKVENTQEFRDALYSLRTDIDGWYENTKVRMNQYHAHLGKAWLTQGKPIPTWFGNPLSQWTTDNFKDFTEKILEWSKDHNENGMNEVHCRIRLLLLRDQALAQNIVLAELQHQIKNNPKDVVDNQSGVRELMAEASNVNEVITDRQYKENKGVDRLKALSKSTFEHVNLVTSQRINRQRLVRVDLERESLLVTQPAKPTKKTIDAKKNKSDQSGPEL